MAQLLEKLDQGVVNATDPSLMDPGELVQADDCIYRPNDGALYRAPGRSKFNTAALANPIVGIKYCAFDSPDPDVLIAHSGGAYWITALAMPTFVNVGAITPGTTLDAIHYRNL